MSATYHVLEDIAARDRSQSEGLARPARIRFFARVTGTGETRLEGRAGLDFGAFMLEEPTFTWGAAAQRPLSQGGIPFCNAVVLRYHQSQGFFSGADMGFVVESGDPTIVLNFSLTFEGITLRTTNPRDNSTMVRR